MLSCGQLLGDLELLDDRAPQPRRAADPAHPHAPLVQLVAAAPDHVAVEAHEEAHLVGDRAPVLRRERVGRQVRHADLDGAGHDVEQRRLPRLVALGARQAPRVGPAAVAVHDDRDVLRHELGGDRRAAWRRTGAGTAWRTWVSRSVGIGSRAAGSGTLDEAQRSQPALEVPLEEGGDQAAALAAVPLVARVGDAQSPVEQGREQARTSPAPARASRAGGIRDRRRRPPATLNARCGPGRTAPGAVVEARRPAGDGERAQQVGVEDEARVVRRARPASAARRRAGGTAGSAARAPR